MERGCGGLEVEDLLSLTHTVHLTGLIFIHSLWRVSSDVSRDGETEGELELGKTMKRRILKRFESERRGLGEGVCRCEGNCPAGIS